MSFHQLVGRIVTKRYYQRSFIPFSEQQTTKIRTPKEKAADFFGLLGAFANWLVPITAILNMQKDANKVNPRMTSALFIYSIFFYTLGCYRTSEKLSFVFMPCYQCFCTTYTTR